MDPEIAFSWPVRCNELLQSLDASAARSIESFSTKESVNALVSELQHQQQALKKQQALDRLQKLSSTINPIAVAADALSHGLAVPSRLFWGLLGLAIKISASRAEFIEVTLKTFESLLLVVPRFEDYLEVLPKSPTLKISIQDVFLAYINLGRQCLKTFDNGFNFLRRIKWIRYQISFEDTLRRLRKLTDAVHIEAGFELERMSLHLAEERHQQIVAGQQEVLTAVTRNLATLDINQPGIFIVPYPPNPSFTGRSAELLGMHEALQRTDLNDTGAQRVVAICGLGGVGKSQLALKYAYDYRSAYKNCFWVTCDSVVKMDGDLAKIAMKLGLPNLGLHQNREQLKDWLSKAGQDYLLIFDNADNINDISDFWPQSSDGCIIVTSQNSSLLLKENVSHGVVLKSLTEDESLELLRKTMAKHDKPIEAEAATAIIKETGGLPLAIRHLGSYMCAMEATPDEFLKDYQDEGEAPAIDAWDESIPPWYSHTLSTFLNYAFERLTKDSISLLTTIIFLDPEAIDEDLFLQKGDSYEPFMKKNKYLLAVRNCVQYDFLSRINSEGTNSLSIHRQVRTYLRRKCSPEQVRQGFEWAFQRLRQVFPHQSAIAEPLSLHWEQCAHWIEHLIAFTDGMLRFMHVIEPPVEIAPLLVDGAIYLWERGLLNEGRNLTLAAKRIVEGQDCDERIIADVYSFHACILSESGDLMEAKKYFQLQVDKRKEKLQKTKSEGKPQDKYDQILLANAYNNLAGVCCTIGEYDDAQIYNELSLRIKEYWGKQLDLQYLQSLSYQNMATLYGQTGRFDEAVNFFEKALSLGANTNYTIRWALTHHNYGCMEMARGNMSSAKHLFKKAYDLRQNSLGDHYDTAITLHMLAGCYQSQGDRQSLLMAKDLLLEAVRILESGACSSDPWRLARTKFKLSTVLALLEDPMAQSLHDEVQILIQGVGGENMDEDAFDALVSYV